MSAAKKLPTDRLPFEPLAVICERRWRPPTEIALTTTTRIGKVSALVGIDVSSVTRWVAPGLTVQTADRVAVELGLHPGEIWPEWWAL